MLNREMSKQEIERELNGKGDFVQIDYLTRLLENKPGIPVKRFIYFKLAKIYEDKKMFNDSGKMFENLAVISVAFSEKTKNFLFAAESYIKDGFFDKADYAVKKAMAEANEYERGEIYFAIKEFYKKQAELNENGMKRNHAAKIYEKLLQMNISEREKKEIKKKLLDLYEKLGKFKEYSLLNRED